MKIYRDPDVVVDAVPGQSFAVAVESSPASTGYEWTEEYDGDLVDFLSRRTVASSPAIGGAMEETLEFKMKRDGSTRITMTLKREWEKDPREVRVFRVETAP